MSRVVLSVEDVSKRYRLGQFGTGTLSHDLNRWWHRVRGKEDPYSKVDAVNDRTQASNDEYAWALQHIDLQVKEGEVLGIIGRNGAGKSTLLKILSQVTQPTSGRVKVKGRIASLLEVGTGFHPELTGRENIFLNGAILGMTKREIQSKLDEIVDFAGVAKYLNTPVKRYSSGMKVRLGFAVAAHLEPEILVVDEVLAVGDAEFQKKAVGKMQDVSKEGGRTVLFVSHNMASIRQLCDRAILLSNGNIIADGNVGSIVDMYGRNEASIGISQIPLSQKKRSAGTGEVLIEEMTILNNNLLSTNFFFYEKPTIKVAFQVTKAIYEAVFWIRFSDLDGTDALLCESYLTQQFSNCLEPGQYTLELTTNSTLLPRDYKISIGVYRENGMAMDLVEDAGLISIQKYNPANKVGYKWQKSYGYIYDSGNWKMNKLNSNGIKQL